MQVKRAECILDDIFRIARIICTFRTLLAVTFLPFLPRALANICFVLNPLTANTRSNSKLNVLGYIAATSDVFNRIPFVSYLPHRYVSSIVIGLI